MRNQAHVVRAGEEQTCLRMGKPLRWQPIRSTGAKSYFIGSFFTGSNGKPSSAASTMPPEKRMTYDFSDNSCIIIVAG